MTSFSEGGTGAETENQETRTREMENGGIPQKPVFSLFESAGLPYSFTPAF